MQAREDLTTRMLRIAYYIVVFTATVPEQGELKRFYARHSYEPAEGNTCG